MPASKIEATEQHSIKSNSYIFTAFFINFKDLDSVYSILECVLSCDYVY